jgi:hypothetical protein
MQKGRNKAFQGEQRLHYKMYKSGKRWLLAGIASATLFSITFVTQNNVKAATGNDTEPTATMTQQLDSQTNENTASDTSSDNTVKASEPETTAQESQSTDSAASTTQTPQSNATSNTQAASTDTASTTEAQVQSSQDAAASANVVLHVETRLDESGKAIVTVTGPANTSVGVTDNQGRAVATLRLNDQGTSVWQTHASGALTFSAVGEQALTTTAIVPAASAEQNDKAAAGAAQLHTNDRDAIVSGSLAERSQTQLDTNDIDPDKFVQSNQTGFGGDFSNLIEDEDGLTDTGTGEPNGDPVELATTDDTVKVNVVTSDSSVVSGSILGTSNTYDVIQLAKGISAQITEVNGKKVALVTAKLLPSITDLVPFYGTLELLVDNPVSSILSLGLNSIVTDVLQGIKDITTISTLVPVTPVADSKLANGDYSKFVVDLSSINVVQLIEDKLESVVNTADPTGSLSGSGVVDENGITGGVADAVQGVATGSLLGKTVVVTPLTVRATTDINDDTNPQDISIASAFYTSNIFEFDFGANPDENYYPLKIQLADKDGDGSADITETGESEPSTGTETGTGTDTGTGTTTTTPTSQKLAGTAVIENNDSVTVTGTGAKPSDSVWVISGSGYADADEATKTGNVLGTLDAQADGTVEINIPAAKARNYYGTTVTLLDQGTQVIAPVDIPANTASATITGTLTVKYNGTAPKPTQADHAGDSIWSQIVAGYGANKLTVKVTAGQQTLNVVLPDVSDFTWEPGATGYGARVHTGDFQLTAAGKALVSAAVAKAYPSAEFDVDAIPYGGDLDIQPGELGLTLNGTIALDTPAASLPSTYQGSLSVQAVNADGTNHGTPIELVSGDFELADGVTPTDGVHQNAFVLTASGLTKLTTALGENGGYNVATAAAGGTLAVASSVVTNYVVHYVGAGVLTPADYAQSITWTESFAADGTPIWTPDEQLVPVTTPVINGFTANYATAYNSGLNSGPEEPQGSTEKITYIFQTPKGTILPDDQFIPVSGDTAPNAQVTLTTSTGGGVTVTADDNGDYEAIVTRGAAPAGSKLTVTATVDDGKGGKLTSPSLELAVQEAPDAPVAIITPVKRGVATVTGNAENGATVEFTVDGESVGSAIATDAGSFTMTFDVKKVPVGSVVQMTQTTDAGISKATSVKVERPDLNAPTAEIVLVAPTMEGNID